MIDGDTMTVTSSHPSSPSRFMVFSSKGGGGAKKKARGRGNAILPYLRAPASFKRLLGSAAEEAWIKRRARWHIWPRESRREWWEPTEPSTARRNVASARRRLSRRVERSAQE